MPSTLCPAERQRGIPRRLFVPTKPGSILRTGGQRNVTRGGRDGMLARLKRYDDNYFVEKPLRGDAGAWPKAGPHNVLGNPAHTGRGVEAAIGAGHPRHAAKNPGFTRGQPSARSADGSVYYLRWGGYGGARLRRVSQRRLTLFRPPVGGRALPPSPRDQPPVRSTPCRASRSRRIKKSIGL